LKKLFQKVDNGQMSLLRKLFRPKPTLSIDFSKEVLTDFLASREIFRIDENTWLPVDCAPHQPQRIYEALLTLSLHDGQWNVYEQIAYDLAQYSLNGLESSFASWAMATDKVEVLTNFEKECRAEKQASSADIIADIKQDFDCVKRSRPRTSKPRFAVWKFDLDYDMRLVEHVVHRFGDAMHSDCLHLDSSRMPAPIDEIAWCFALFYVNGSHRTSEDYQHFAVGAIYLANIDNDEASSDDRAFKHPSGQEFIDMTSEQRERFKETASRNLNIAMRRAYTGPYWSLVWELMCHRTAKWHAITLPDHRSKSSQ
jgi:hypothetical protein